MGGIPPVLAEEPGLVLAEEPGPPTPPVMARVYYVGDWAVLTGPVFAETPFYYSHKGLDIFNYGHC